MVKNRKLEGYAIRFVWTHFRCLESGGDKTESGNRNLKFRERLNIGDLWTYVITKHNQQRVLPRL